jgi:hypothetical protein
MIAVFGTALSVLVLVSSESMPQDSGPVPTIQASVPVAAETDPSGSSGLYRTGSSSYPNRRQLFAKLSYVLRY